MSARVLDGGRSLSAASVENPWDRGENGVVIVKRTPPRNHLDETRVQLASNVGV